ncbi:CHC2 zinc finger domain-containing protein [Paenibacillus polymyxa]|uniref:CHC2 zinc finger domain-containing protein n=1 Tax=Paenibacillus polymyxa TaxID=1406 RepID=UPI001867089E|nr:CHC2 zinc finger domain-containing protein [Paenibacillus polymyxa]MBE3650482.1 hypothetical protein [Paenibacillus polymyxa]
MKDKFKIMLDEHTYTCKPTDAGGIVNRIVKNPADITIEELILAIEQGKTVLPAFLGHAYNGKIRKSKECWSSQQLIFLDFDNESEVFDPLPGKPKNKKKIKDIRMTYDEAIEHFKNIALFLYKSFSCTDDHPKFRVVIALDRVVYNRDIIRNIFTRLKQLYPYIDSKCLEESRLFYGGTDVHRFDFSNRLNVDELLQQDEGKKGLHYILSSSNNIPPFCLPSIQGKSTTQTTTNNIEYIINRDVSYLQSVIKPVAISLSQYDLYEYLYKIDFSTLLGVNHKHCCMYHNDNSPSALIKVKEDTGDYMYHCFGCGFSGNIITCIEKMFEDRQIEIRRGQVVELLKEIYMIDDQLSVWGEQQKRELESNIALLLSRELEELEPNLHKLIVRNVPNLVALHNVAIQNITSENYTDNKGNVLFFKDLKSITVALGKSSVDKVTKDINFYTYLGMLNKINPKELPKSLRKKAVEFQLKNHYKYQKNFYSFPSYTISVRRSAEQRAVEWKEKGYTKKELTREMIYRGHGEEVADKVYPQMKGEQFSATNIAIADELVKIGLSIIEQKGWTTEKEIQENLHLHWKGQSIYKAGMIKTIRAEFLESYGLVKKKLNKGLSERLGIDVPTNGKGNPCYPQIIYKAD